MTSLKVNARSAQVRVQFAHMKKAPARGKMSLGQGTAAP
jgi:hypothetical protein